MVVREKKKQLGRTIEKKILYRLFYPQVPLILCSQYRSLVAAMPLVSIISISNDPPFIALALAKKSRTCSVVKQSKAFSINWVNYKDRKLRQALLELSKPYSSDTPDKLKANGIPYRMIHGIPALKGEACILCHLERVIPTGDHFLMIGKIREAHTSADFKEYWSFSTYAPVMYLGSAKARPLQTF